MRVLIFTYERQKITLKSGKSIRTQVKTIGIYRIELGDSNNLSRILVKPACRAPEPPKMRLLSASIPHPSRSLDWRSTDYWIARFPSDGYRTRHPTA
jgi:hypothetical protein